MCTHGQQKEALALIYLNLTSHLPTIILVHYKTDCQEDIIFHFTDSYRKYKEVHHVLIPGLFDSEHKVIHLDIVGYLYRFKIPITIHTNTQKSYNFLIP